MADPNSYQQYYGFIDENYTPHTTQESSQPLAVFQPSPMLQPTRSFRPHNQPPHSGGNFQNPSYQIFPPSFYPPNQPPHSGGNFQNLSHPMWSNQQQFQFQNQIPRHGVNFTNQQYMMYSPPPQFQTQTPPTGSSGSKVSDTQFEATPDEPEICTQPGLEGITLEEGNPKKRVAWSDEDDMLLLQSWLNISTDVVVGNDQKSRLFWDRIEAQYEEFRNAESPSRTSVMLKSRFTKLNRSIQAFTGCYNKASSPWKSGHSENDIMAQARALYKLETGQPFKLECAWRMVKDQPKWKGGSMTTQPRRQKNSADGAYSSSSNQSDSVECDEYEATEPTTRPKGKKSVKRKVKETEPQSTSSGYVYNPEVLATWNARAAMMADFKELRTRELDLMEKQLNEKRSEQRVVQMEAFRQLLMQDKSQMDEEQLANHKVLCDFAKRELGIE